MKCLLVALPAFLLASHLCLGDDSDDTLKFYLAKSDVVVLGTIASQPLGLVWELGVVHYCCSFDVSDVLKGDVKLKGKTIRVNIMRFEMDENDRSPLVAKGKECILFLKYARGSFAKFRTADFWFGLQQPSPWMAKSLTRLAEQEIVEPVASPDKE